MAYETAKIITEEGIEGVGRYYSAYRGIVTNNIDEAQMNRLEVFVPEVMGGISTWAYAKGQHGSINSGFKFLAPKVGDIVYVTFEFGDPTKPLWEYHGWAVGQIPPSLDGPNVMGLITPEGNTVIIDDDKGTLKVYFEGRVTIHSNKEILIDSDTDVVVNSKDSIILHQGENRGLINIEQLTQKLNQTIQELEQLRATFNSHTHAGVTPGPGTTAPTPTQVSKPFSQYVLDDYEDKTCIH